MARAKSVDQGSPPVLASMNANVWEVTDPIQRLIRPRVAVDPDRLADPSTPPEDLVPAS